MGKGLRRDVVAPDPLAIFLTAVSAPPLRSDSDTPRERRHTC
ncbi:MAG TPA: hypothetical protein VF376_11170 [Thermoanaerobaculia bacterium]